MPELTTSPNAVLSDDDIILIRDGAAVGLKKATIGGLIVYIETQLELPDFPDLAGNEDKLVVVNGDATGFAYVDPAPATGGFVPPNPAGNDGKVLKVVDGAYALADDEVSEGGGGEYDGPDHVFISQVDYDALSPPDADTLYFIPE